MPQTNEQIEEFLNKLDSDVGFRDTLICDPATILDQYDIEYDPSELPSPSQVVLPPEGDVHDREQAYKDALFPDNEFCRNNHNLLLDE